MAAMLTATVWFVGGLFYRRLGREAIGIGDAKLLGAGSLAVGMPSLAAMVFVACVGGIIAGLLARRTEALPTTQGVPFGPFVAYSVFLFVLHPYPGLTQP